MSGAKRSGGSKLVQAQFAGEDRAHGRSVEPWLGIGLCNQIGVARERSALALSPFTHRIGRTNIATPPRPRLATNEPQVIGHYS